MGNKNEQTVELKPINVLRYKITIIGDSDLVLNKMNDYVRRVLTDARKDKAKDISSPNQWEQIITAMHWQNPVKYDPADYSEELLDELLHSNAPCISAFALKKSFGDAVVRNEIDKYKTKFDAGVNIYAKGGLVPITFAEHYVDEKLMSPKKGSPVLVYLNRFVGWKATFEIGFVDNVYSIDQIANIINLAGFGLGIGSGRTSGYGRYHIDTDSSIQ